MEDDKKQEEKDQSRKRRIIIHIIIIIIIILSLLTSCSCTSSFFGKIGNIFENRGDYIIDEDTNDLETILNKELKFNKDFLEISLSDQKSKLGFTYKNIKPKKFTCTTSDASIATCYVKDHHVIIIPKKEGTVTITLQTEVNHKIYKATAQVKITKENRYIKLASNKGTINLAYEKERLVGYTLVNLSGKINATSSNEKIAKVEVCDGYLKITAFKKGKVTITVSITYNDITYTTLYTLNVINSNSDYRKDSNNFLKDIKVSSGKLEPSFDKNQQNYRVKVESDVDKITIRAIADSNKSTIIYNGKKVSSLEDLKLNYGDNTVVITVTAEDGTTRDYVVNIYREYEQEKKDSNNFLRDIKISSGKLEPVFDKNQQNYRVEVESDVDKITIRAIADSNKSTITCNGKKVSSLEDLKLNYGDNTVVISVTAEDGTTRDYVVNIYRKSEYTIKFEKPSYELDLYADDMPQAIFYKVYKNGVEVTDYHLDDINVKIADEYKDAVEVLKQDKGVIVIKPDSKKIASMNNKKTQLFIDYEGYHTTTNIEFKLHDYYLIANKNTYDVVIATDNDKVTGQTDVILRTDLFSGNIEVIESSSHKQITICSMNKNACVTISTDSDVIERLEYTGEQDTPASLPFKVIATKDGEANIHVSGTAYGKEFTSFDVKLQVIRKYIVILDANGGQFNLITNQYEALISKEETLDLSSYDEPYKIDPNDACKYFKFIGYSKESDGSVLYNRTDKKMINNLEEDITLYAIYEEASNPVPDDLIKKTLWLTDVPLFHNEEYYKVYNEDKVIYPGAHGYYIMNFKNESSNTLIISGMTLKEETICIEDKGCLNMGYMIQYRPADRNNVKYYYGSDNQYKILNQDVSPLVPNYVGKTILFDEKITVNPQEEVALSLFWKWVEIDSESDKLDTMIGNQAAKSRFDDTINDKYRLFVGLNFETSLSCVTKSSDSQ